MHQLPLLVIACVALSVHGALHPVEFATHFKRQFGCGANVTAQCTTSLSDCLKAVCEDCAMIPQIAQCCSLPTYTLSIECLSNSNGGGFTASTTNLTVDHFTACARIDSTLASCENQTSGFVTEPFGTRASCLCYSSESWQPAMYDGNFSLCLGFFSSVSPAVYSSIVNDKNFTFSPCSAAGNVRAPANVSATTTVANFTLTRTSSTPRSFIGGLSTQSDLASLTSASASNMASSSSASVASTSGSEQRKLEVPLSILGFATLIWVISEILH